MVVTLIKDVGAPSLVKQTNQEEIGGVLSIGRQLSSRQIRQGLCLSHCFFCCSPGEGNENR